MTKTARLEIRLTGDEKQRIEVHAAQEKSTPSAMLRDALAAVLHAKPLLTAKDVEALSALREEVRRVGVNLNALLRLAHLEENGVKDNGPRLKDYQDMAADLRAALDRLTAATRALRI